MTFYQFLFINNFLPNFHSWNFSYERFSQDLEYGKYLDIKPLNRKIQAVAEGDPHQNYRAAMLKATKNPSTHVLTVEEQVDCLVDLATDKNVIGRIYVGWSPWIWLVGLFALSFSIVDAFFNAGVSHEHVE